jgi:hypothetical protein
MMTSYSIPKVIEAAIQIKEERLDSTNFFILCVVNALEGRDEVRYPTPRWVQSFI